MGTEDGRAGIGVGGHGSGGRRTNGGAGNGAARWAAKSRCGKWRVSASSLLLLACKHLLKKRNIYLSRHSTTSAR